MVVLPSSLVGCLLGKSFEISLNNLLISLHIRIVGCSFFITCFILLHSTFSENLGSLHFIFFELTTFCEFSASSARIYYSIKPVNLLYHQHIGGYTSSALYCFFTIFSSFPCQSHLFVSSHTLYFYFFVGEFLPRFRARILFIALRCLPTKLVQNQGGPNAESLVRVMTSMLQTKPLAIFVKISLQNSILK